MIPRLYQSEASYSHQWPWCGERFLGLSTAEERFLGRLRDWHLGERDPRGWEGPVQRISPAGFVSEMSNTVGGRSARLKAAASGGAASITSRVSGRAARGSGKIRPGLYTPASLASLLGSVNCTGPAGDPEKDLWVGCWRAGEERPDPEKVHL